MAAPILSILQDYCTVQLPKNLNTLIDRDLYRLVNSLTWGLVHAKGEKIYAIHQERRSNVLITVKLHQFVANPSNGLRVDHKNRDTLDNRRENLRIATSSENCCNAGLKRRSDGTSKYKGVSFHGAKTQWNARITKDRRTHSLGYFQTEKEAAIAYDRSAAELHGEFALTNRQLYPGDFDGRPDD